MASSFSTCITSTASCIISSWNSKSSSGCTHSIKSARSIFPRQLGSFADRTGHGRTKGYTRRCNAGRSFSSAGQDDRAMPPSQICGHGTTGHRPFYARKKMLFYNDFLQMENIIQRKNYTSPLQSFLPPGADLPVEIVEDEILYHQQLELSHILETAASCEEAMNALKRSSLAHFEWETEKWRLT